MTDAITLLARAASAGEDIYDAAVSLGQDAAENMDAGRWKIGDAGNLLGKRYGTDVTGRFSKDIGVEKSRVEEYKTVCAFWQKSARAEFLDCPTIRYSHFRAAMIAGSLAKAQGIMRDAANGAWSSEKTRIEAKRVAGSTDPIWEKVLDADAQITRVYGQEDGVYVVLRLDSQPPEELLQAYHDRRVVHVIGKTEYREEVKA